MDYPSIVTVVFGGTLLTGLLAIDWFVWGRTNRISGVNLIWMRDGAERSRSSREPLRAKYFARFLA
jgi:hypothetical protein